MKSAVTIVFFVVATLTSYGQNESLKEILYQMQSAPELKNASWAVEAVDLNTQNTIISVSSYTSLIPASTLKTLTTGIALEKLGRDFKFETKLAFRGEISDSLLFGDLIIIGGGDPGLGNENFSNQDLFKVWPEILKSKGIKKIEGNLIADLSHYDRILTPESWIYQDLGNYYGASPSALSIFNNQFPISFEQNPVFGKVTKVLINEYTPKNLSIINEVTTGKANSGDQAYVYGFPGSKEYFIKGTIPPGKGIFTIKASIPEPPTYFLERLRSALKREGITVFGRDSLVYGEQIRVSILDTIFSATLSELIREVNVNSNNLFAEHLLLELKGIYEVNTAQEVLNAFFSEHGLDSECMFVQDGSGLSKSNAFCMNGLLKFLNYMKSGSNFEVYLNSFPIAGEEGTVSGLFRNNTPKAKFYVKSGTLNRVKAYVGYAIFEDRTIAFAMSVNNFSANSSKTSALLEKLMLAIDEEFFER